MTAEASAVLVELTRKKLKKILLLLLTFYYLIKLSLDLLKIVLEYWFSKEAETPCLNQIETVFLKMGTHDGHELLPSTLLGMEGETGGKV